MLLALVCARQRADTNLREKGGEKKVLNKTLVQIYSNNNGNNTNNAYAVNKVIFQEQDETGFFKATCCFKGPSLEPNGT